MRIFQTLFSLALTIIPATSAIAATDVDAQTVQTAKAPVRYSVPAQNPTSIYDMAGSAVLVNAPMASVRKVVTDFRNYEKFIKGFDQSRVLAKSKSGSDVYLSVPVLHGAATIWAVVRVDPPVKEGSSGERIVARFTKGNVKDFRAVWRLEPVDATHTIVKLELLVDPDLPVPASLVTKTLQSSAEKGVISVRDRSEKEVPTSKTASAPAHPAPEPTAVAKQ